MALGVPGTGPYGEIRTLREEIRRTEYELQLMDSGMHRNLKKKREKLKQIIEANRERIREITKSQKHT